MQWPGARDALVEPMSVVKLLELPECMEEVALVPDQGPVHELVSAGLHPPLHDQVLRRPRHPGGGRVCGGAQDPDAAAAVLDHHEYAHPGAGQGDRLKEVTGQEGVGSTPASLRIFQTVEAAIFTPGTSNSP